ncbi:hypothetical protein MHK_008006 [Candidatus Magnetomorum sp. HK-1]|nr:hypothetical protein MHK_008006 [Candidatus Magnetomorum sp. HK-1]
MSTINNIEEHNLDEEHYEFQDSISGELGKVKGIVKQSKTNIKITETDPDWIAGKERGDKEAADRFAEKFWTNELTEKLSKRIEKSDKLLFLSVPSSSKNNVHPISLIEKLSTEFDGEYLIGETFFDVLHERQSKQIRPFERVFHPRLYEPVNSEDLIKLLTGKDVIIADDIFTTGGSAASLIRTLDGIGISVKTVIGYFGNTNLAVPPQIVSAMRRALKNKEIDINARELSKHLTFTETKIIIELIKNVRSKNDKTELTQKIQRIFNN